MRSQLALVLSLAAGSCAPTPSPQASQNTPSEPTAAPELGSASTNERASVAAPAAPTEAAPAEPPPAAWRACSPAEVEAVRSAPVAVGGEVTTVGARLDGGGLATALPHLELEGAASGRWLCLPGSIVEVELRSALRGVEFGPRWGLPSPSRDADSPRRPSPLNLLAEAVEATWSPSERAHVAAMDAFESCTVSNGVTAATGLFVLLMSGEARTTAPGDTAWTILPAVRRDGEPLYEVAFTWSIGSERQTARWYVSPDRPGCASANELGEIALRNAEGVPASRPRVIPTSPAPIERPSDAADPFARANAYLLAHTSEFEALASWIAFRQRLDGFEAGPWNLSNVSPDGAVTARWEFTLGEERHTLAWRVVSEAALVEPESVVSRWLRLSQPRYRPGLSSAEARTLPEAPPETAVETATSEIADAVVACSPDAPQVEVEWRAVWDGRVALVSTNAGPAERRCIEGALTAMRLDRFSGPTVTRTTRFTR